MARRTSKHKGQMKKPTRERKRNFYNSIREQIEFYFSDINLSKDRFFGKLLTESPYIDISYILNCNKIKKLTRKKEDIVKAVSNSKLVKVTEDGEKLYRTEAVREVGNLDNCTIYVEDIPPEANHDWLKGVFKQFGEVLYVSLPHYRNSTKIKGFAFIEFGSEEAVSNALKAFRSLDCCLSSEIDPAELLSVKSYDGDKTKVERKKETVNHPDDIKVIVENQEQSVKVSSESPIFESLDDDKVKEDEKQANPKLIEVDTKVKSEASGKQPTKTKRKTSNETSIIKSETNEKLMETVKRHESPPKKKLRLDETKIEKKCKNEQKDDILLKQVENIPKDEIISADVKMESGAEYSSVDDCAEDSKVDRVENADQTPSKDTKHKKQKRSRKLKEILTYGMHIMSKRAWKQLRNKYLNEQRSQMQKIKKQLRNLRRDSEESEVENSNSDSEDNSNTESAISAESKKDVGPETHTESEVSKLGRVVLLPGTIVRVTFAEPIADVKNFKIEIRSYADIQYIDIDEDLKGAYIRCSNSEAASLMIGLNRWPNMYILEGDEEKSYFEKIKQNRLEKLEMKTRTKRRGRTRLMEKVINSHITFSD